jgi:hypothetical protein
MYQIKLGFCGPGGWAIAKGAITAHPAQTRITEAVTSRSATAVLKRNSRPATQVPLATLFLVLAHGNGLVSSSNRAHMRTYTSKHCADRPTHWQRAGRTRDLAAGVGETITVALDPEQPPTSTTTTRASARAASF